MSARRLQRASALLVVGLLLLGLVGCGTEQDDRVIFPSTTAPTTTLPDPIDGVSVDVPRPRDLAGARAEMDAAVASGDLCEVVAEFERPRPEAVGETEVAEVFETQAAAARAAADFTPAEMTTAWSVVAEATKSAAAAARGVSDIDDPRIRRVFDDSEFKDSWDEVLAWSDAGCP